MTSTTGPIAGPTHVQGCHADEVLVVLDDHALPAGLGRLRHDVGTALTRATPRVVVDISGLDRLSSATVAALLWANRHCVHRGGAVVLLNPSSSSLGVLRRTGLLDLLTVRTDRTHRGAA